MKRRNRASQAGEGKLRTDAAAGSGGFLFLFLIPNRIPGLALRALSKYSILLDERAEEAFTSAHERVISSVAG